MTCRLLMLLSKHWGILMIYLRFSERNTPKVFPHKILRDGKKSHNLSACTTLRLKDSTNLCINVSLLLIQFIITLDLLIVFSVLHIVMELGRLLCPSIALCYAIAGRCPLVFGLRALSTTICNVARWLPPSRIVRFVLIVLYVARDPNPLYLPR